MKKLLIIALLPFILACNNKNKELQEKIQAQIVEIEKAIELNSIKISAAPIPEKDLETSLDAFKENKNYNSSFFDSLKIETTSKFPNSYFLIDYDEYKICRLLGYSNFYFGDNPNRKPKFEVQKVIYADGQAESYENAILNKQEALKTPYLDKDELKSMVNSGLYFIQKNSRPIIAAEVKLITNFPNTQDYLLAKNQQTIKTNFGTIEILEIEGNGITFKYPASLAHKIEINAKYKNGKFLVSKGSQTFKTNHEIKQLQEIIEALKIAKNKVGQGKINTEAELKKYFEKEFKQSELKNEEMITHSEYFSANIDQAIISVAEADKPIESVHTFYISKFSRDRYKETGYEICEDAKTNKKGIIGWDGKWIVAPTYFDLSQHNFVKNYVQVALKENEGANTDYWLDKKKHQLHKPNYTLNSYSLQNDHPKLIIVGRLNPSSRNLGVANKETGQLIIPIKYDGITLSKGNVICDMEKLKTSTIFNETGKQISVKQLAW